MDDKSKPTPKNQSATPARPFFRPASGRETTPSTPAQTRRSPARPFSVPPGSRPPTPPRPIGSHPATPERAEAVAPLPATSTPETPAPIAAESAESGETPRRDSDGDRLDIVTGESLLDVSGELDGKSWGSLQSHEQTEVEHPSDWTSLEEPSTEPRNAEDELRITSEGGLDWDSWEYGRNTSDFAATGEGFVINRHELPLEANDIGAGGSAAEIEFARRSSDEPRVPDESHMPSRGSYGGHVTHETPASVEAVEALYAPRNFESTTESAEQGSEEPLPSIAEYAADGEPTSAAMADSEAASITPEQLESLKEVEPWAMLPEPARAPDAEAHPAEVVAAALERVAERIRRGEIVLPAGAASEQEESALALALTALLRSAKR